MFQYPTPDWSGILLKNYIIKCELLKATLEAF